MVMAKHAITHYNITHTGLATEYYSELNKHKHLWNALLHWLDNYWEFFLKLLQEAIHVLLTDGRLFHSAAPLEFMHFSQTA